MKIKNVAGLIMLLSAFFATTAEALALTNSFNIYESKLSTGKWVKIRVNETGVHEITADQLAEMGFSDINAVKIFGEGGYVLDEVLNGNHADDLSQIPVLVSEGKVIFYAHGSVKATASSVTNSPYHNISVNPYSRYGCYFITDSRNYQPLAVTSAVDVTDEATRTVEQCYDYVIHNNDIYSFLNSGKTFYGEDLQVTSSIPFEMPKFVDGTTVNLALSIGANVDANSAVAASVNGASVTLSSNTMKKITSNREFEVLSTTGTSAAVAASDSYSLALSLEDVGINSARLDYFTVTYLKSNEFPEGSSQMRMAFSGTTGSTDVAIKNVNGTVVVWDVTDGNPSSQHVLAGNGGDVCFRQTAHNLWEQYVAFKPSEQLKTVTIEGVVENQNLHGCTTPNMVIIYPENFKEHAEKLAAIHLEHDGLEVLTVEQQQIFNEYSSGVQDATAYRLFLKMLYDRNPEKLKYLLLLGCGSFDNSHILGIKSENQLLTYQSTDSNGIVSSYVTDDYFGFLADNSGKSIPTDVLTISVGRIPAKTVEDAEAAIAKTLDYIISDNSEVWRGNALIMSDKGDNDLHATQAAALELLIEDVVGSEAINLEKIYQEWFTIANISENIATGAENWGRLRLEELLKEGLLYVSYIGHAGPRVLTHDNRLWSTPDVQSVRYPYLPFFTMAACETASFDADNRAICEELVLAPRGGAIGALAAARTVYSSQNDKLNRALAEQIFSVKSDGSYRTIGEACMEAKKSFGQTYNYNKLSFTLFGDPAVKIKFPVNRCSVNAINGTTFDAGNVTIYPLTKISVSGVVNDADGNVDTSFNGEITVSLFDKEIAYKDMTSPNTKVVYSTTYPREKLSHSTGKVENGVFTVDLTVPANCVASGESGLIRIFAKGEDGRLVSGSEGRITIGAYDESLALSDSKAPAIKQLLIDGQSQGGKVYASANPTVNFEVVDETAINTKPNDIAGSMQLIVDDGKTSVSSLSNYTEVTDGGKTVTGSVNLHDLQAGKHTLKLEVSDVAGNVTMTEAVFYVVDDFLDCTLDAAADVVRDRADLTIETELELIDCIVTVQDTQNNTVLVKSVADNSFSWDLCDSDGNRVKPGKYLVSAKFNTEKGYGLTGKQSVIVLKN